ncbi:MAG: LPS-assembly protein LptD [Campylobacterales bacterium]|nr:LPS-assembly protein LptD [Campylobacterales bacterium]
MLKLALLSLLLSLSLLASDKVKIYASAMESEGNIVYANKGITVIYQDYVLTAQRARYDKDSGDLELYENIRVNKGGNFKILGKYAKLNIAKKERLFEPFYMIDKDSELWLSADKGETKSEDIEISSGTLSGCNPMDPIWTLDFSSSDYNTDSKWMNVYNARLYIGDIPILYTPYFGYSLDTSRRTGLLMPQLGLSDDEGIYYEQPIYIAEQNWWDLELRPQLRTQRGEGIYSTFRFVDSKTSRGEITTGYFKEKKEFFLENSLQNDSHYGYNIEYDNSDFINQWFGTDLSGQSGMYADINHMNDVDYINLSSNDTENQNTATQVLSRINLFYNTDNFYVGTYFKYYQDLTLSNNDNTLQQLPTLHLHSYLDTLLQDHLLYALDVQSNNIQRNINTSVVQTDINLPITLQTPLFDEYLNLAYKANLYMQHSTFRGTEELQTNINYRDGYYARNSHTLALSTQLTKAYETFSHVIGLNLSYNRAGSDTKNGFYEDYVDMNSSEQELYSFYQISDIVDALQIDFSQYLYDTKANEILYHRLSQNIAYAENGDQLGELENELEYKLTDYLSFYNDMFFNYDELRFSKIFNSLTFNHYGLNLTASHLYKDTFDKTATGIDRYTSYLTSSIGYTYNKHYSYSAVYNYDLEAQQKKNMSIGFMYKKRCWDFGLRYSENRRPILTNTGTPDYIDDRYVYLTIVLKPLMQSNNASSFISYRLPQE